MQKVRLLSVCDVYQPQTIATKEFCPTGKYIVYGANGAIGHYTKYNHAESEILMACRGATCGAINVSQPYSWINGNAMVITPNGSIDISKKYLQYYLTYCNKDDIITGTAQPQITRQNLKDFQIVICDIDEQNRIVAKIEELFSELDSGVETLKKTKQQLAVYRQAVLKEAFASSTASYRHLEDLCFFITKGTTPSKTAMTAGNGEIPFIKVYNLTFDNTLDFSIDPTFVDKDTHIGFLGRSIVYPGDVLMNIVGPPMGKVSIVPDLYSEWNINQAIARFRCLDGLYNKYLAYFLGYSDTVEKMKSKAKATAGQFNLTLEICRDIQIPVPLMEEQKKIVFDIETKLSQQQKIADTIELALQQAVAMRQSILKKAFEGEL